MKEKCKKVLLIAKSKILELFYRKPKVLTSTETIKYIIQNSASIGRMGDGELAIILKKDLAFQNNSELLRNRLSSLKSRNKFLLCIPNIFFSNKRIKNDCVEREGKFWIKHKFRYGGFWKKYFSANKVLGDAFISRFYLRRKDKTLIGEYITLLKQLWEARNVVFVEGAQSRLGVGNDLFDNAASIKRILCPAQNAFDKYSDILQTIQQHVKKDDLLILALGPTATVLAYDLSELGYQALDLGHVDVEYEWYLMGTNKKVPIPNKHVNECNSLGESKLGKLENLYQNQIIAKV